MSEDKQKELGFETYMRGMTGGVEVLTPDAEQLRALEHGIRIRVWETKHGSVRIDAPDDVPAAVEELRRQEGVRCAP